MFLFWKNKVKKTKRHSSDGLTSTFGPAVTATTASRATVRTVTMARRIQAEATQVTPMQAVPTTPALLIPVVGTRAEVMAAADIDGAGVAFGGKRATLGLANGQTKD